MMNKAQVLKELQQRKGEMQGAIDGFMAKLSAIEEMERLLLTESASPASKKRKVGRPRKAKTNGPPDHEAAEAAQADIFDRTGL